MIFFKLKNFIERNFLKIDNFVEINLSYLAHDVAKGPISQSHGGHDERYADEKTFVSDGQVQDVQVGHRLHLGVA